MNRTLLCPISIGHFVLNAALLCSIPLFAQETDIGPIVISPDHYDTSSHPVRETSSVEPQPGIHRVAPLRGRPWPAVVNPTPDPVVQVSEASVTPFVSTTNLVKFDGIPDLDGVAPPDANASVGATQVVETVNTSFQVFSKSGASLLSAREISTIFSGFGGVCQNGPYYTDPVVLYDKLANRWLITIAASSNSFATGTECVAVSFNNDATGTYHRYAFSFGTRFPDYPKWGVWPDAYYASYNMFSSTGSYLGADACAYDRANMLAGGAANAHCFLKTSDFSFLPSDLDGTALFTAGEPNFFVELDPAGSSALHLFKFHVDFTTPSLSTFKGPTVLTVAPFTPACPTTGTCISQSGTTQKLDSLGDRLMFRLAYRSVGGHEALVVTHSVKPSSTASALRWYEIRSPRSTAPVVFQQGTFASTSLSLWMGSIGMDKNGDIALGYSASSGSTHPSIYYTGRTPTDAAGAMETPALVIAGGGSQTGGLSRWGDYSSMSIDPTDGCTFWYAQEYLKTSGSFNWSTHLHSFKFSGCQ